MNFQPLKDFLDFYLPMLGVPGTDTVIYKGHEEVFRYQSGYDSLKYRTPVRHNALYNMYSITKILTGVAATQLIERGEILITDPLYAYFPEYKDMKVKVKREDGSYDVVPAKNPITIKQILTMTGGFNYDLNLPAIQKTRELTGGRCPTLDVIRAMADEPLDYEPGSIYNYSLGLDVMGGVIELVSGMKLGQYMKENVFEPLGMKNSTYNMTPDVIDRLATQYDYDAENKCAREIAKDSCPYRFGTEYESGGAGLISSVDDMILLADALAHLGKGKNGNRILSEYGVRLMSRNHLTPEQRRGMSFFHGIGYDYGYGVRMNNRPEESGNLAPLGMFGWDGAKGSVLMADPENKISFFYAEHMGGLHGVIIPRLINVIYGCLED